MKTGTRRMWSRRVLRAGWMIAPVLDWPLKFYKLTCVCSDTNKFSIGKTIWSCFLAGVLITAYLAIRHNNRVGETATPEQVLAAVKGNKCMIDLMPRYQTHFGRALQIRDLERGSADCAQNYETKSIIELQKKAIEQAK
jgi:hypothetical protein